MTALRDPFDNVMKREDKYDYVPWSSVADRLDDALGDTGWSFAIMGIGSDWVHGRLTIGDRHIENIGYAENADASWSKEVLKHAATDAFKRCAALAGVARYLYDKDGHSDNTQSSGRGVTSSSPRPPARPTVVRSSTEMPEMPPNEWDVEPAPFAPIGSGRAAMPGDECPDHPGVQWRGEPGDLYHGPKPYHRHPDNIRKARGA